MAVVDELVTILGVDLAKDALSKIDAFRSGVGAVRRTLLGLSAAAGAAAAAAGLMVRDAAERGMELEKLSASSGIAAESLQAWAYAAAQAGGASEAVQGDLAALASRFRGTGRDAEAAMLGMAERMKGMSAGRAGMYGKAFGLSDDTILLLRKGREGVEALRAEAGRLGGIIPEESIRRAADFKRKMEEWRFAWRGISVQASIALIPALERVLDLLKGWTLENREWISLSLSALLEGAAAGFERFGTMLGAVGDVFAPFSDAVAPFTAGMSAMELAAHLVTGALAGLLAVFSPLLIKAALIGAAVLAASAALEDLFSSVTTGKGAFADLFAGFAARWPALAAALRGIGGFIREHIGGAMEAAGGVAVKALEGIGGAFAAVLDGLNGVAGPTADFFGSFTEKFPALHDALRKLAELLKTALTGAFRFVADGVRDFVDRIFAALKKIGGAVGYVTGALDKGAALLGFGKDGADTDRKLPERAPPSPDLSRQGGDPPPAFDGSPGPATEDGFPPAGADTDEASLRELRRGVAQTGRNLAAAARVMGVDGGGAGASGAGAAASVPASPYLRDGGRTYTDMRTINQHIATNDPQQAADAVVRGINEQAPNFPGSFAPAI